MNPRAVFKIRHHRSAILFAALMLGAACASVWIFRTREPVIQGRTLSVWVRQLNEGDAAQCQEAAEAIRGMESRVVPALIADIAPRDGRLKDSFTQAYQHLPSIHAEGRDRYLTVDVERGYAATALGTIGSPALAAVPALIAASMETNSFCAARAKAALIQIRQVPADQPVLPATDIHDLTNWLRNAEVMLVLGSNLEANAGGWVTAIGKDQSRRFDIVEALGHNGCEPDASVLLLRGLLTNEEASIRMNALNMLLLQRKFAQSAYQDVARCTNDSDANVRSAAAYALLFEFPSPSGVASARRNVTTQTNLPPR